MKLSDWAAKKKLKAEATSQKEIQDLLKLADQAIGDCKAISESSSISQDHYHQSVFMASLPCAKAVLRASGYRIGKETEGGHDLLLHSLSFTVDPGDKYIPKLQAARKLRQRTQYDSVGVTLEKKEINELLDVVRKLRTDVDKWIRENHPSLLQTSTDGKTK